ncbi:hypothetical protein F2Q69_00008220 [Brassica cretica]|uniref:Uncharacterized protein n=1 Tax=Brassica cretica TaxID=69181 RepID=A0A8S9P1A7_BRACR|nr:hypothetical protein F2Q69_00008220 [Brassica cretica]
MKPDLLYLGADYPVSRLELFQGRGYDAAIKSVPEPEANQLHQSANQRTNQDIYSYQEDMNFTNRRFSSPSICEHPSLEVVSSPMKKIFDPKQLMDFKMDLLAFQKAKNEEKSPRKYGVMVQLPKPVKPVLQLPNLESHRFNLSQTKQWRPGDVSKNLRSIYSDPGGVEELLPCTKAHMIRRIYLWPHLPYLEFQAF